MNTIQSVKTLNVRLEAWLASLKAIPTPEIPERKPPERRRRDRKIPIRRMGDQAEREFIKNLRKQMLERAKRQIEAAQKKVAALKEKLGSFTIEEAVRWYGGNRSQTITIDASKARAAYRKYLMQQIKYWEGFARMRPAYLAQLYVERFL